MYQEQETDRNMLIYYSTVEEESVCAANKGKLILENLFAAQGSVIINVGVEAIDKFFDSLCYFLTYSLSLIQANKLSNISSDRSFDPVLSSGKKVKLDLMRG